MVKKTKNNTPVLITQLLVADVYETEQTFYVPVIDFNQGLRSTCH